MVSAAKKASPALALLVHPKMGVLSSLQHSFKTRGMHSVVSRDMSTTLLAISQHDFAVCVVHHRVVEEGDGWALGSVLRRLFPDAHIAVICSEKDVASLQSAINNRLDQIFDEHTGSDHIAESVTARLGKHETDHVQ